MLTVNSIWGWIHPPFWENCSRQKTAEPIRLIFNFLISWVLLPQGSVTWPTLDIGFFDYNLASLKYFFMKSFSIVRSYQYLAIHIKCFGISGVVGLETSWKVRFLTIFWCFSRFLCFNDDFFANTAIVCTITRHSRCFENLKEFESHFKKCRPHFSKINLSSYGHSLVKYRF